jgi:hypothetical protein
MHQLEDRGQGVPFHSRLSSQLSNRREPHTQDWGERVGKLYANSSKCIVYILIRRLYM